MNKHPQYTMGDPKAFSQVQIGDMAACGGSFGRVICIMEDAGGGPPFVTLMMDNGEQVATQGTDWVSVKPTRTIRVCGRIPVICDDSLPDNELHVVSSIGRKVVIQL